MFVTGKSSSPTPHHYTLLTPMNSFPYTDTLKMLQKWGPGCQFYGHGSTTDLESLTALLASTHPTTSSPPPNHPPPLLALFTEFPGNPLLTSADLPALRELADRYGFLIVVDETIGNFVNVDVLGYADLVVSSLTKVFSGETNVMGGSMIVNPHQPFYTELKAVFIDLGG